MAQTTFNGNVRAIGGFNPYGVNAVYNVASGDNTLTLSAADHGGKLITVNDTTMIFTVPESNVSATTGQDGFSKLNNLGLTFRMLWLATGATGTEINLSGSDEFVGPISIAVESAVQTQFLAEAGDDFVSINMNATTTGGIIGSYVEITCVASGQWIAAKSMLMGSGVIAIPFAVA